ncbi:MAG: type I restriction enzyme, R subunit, partial [Methanohalophilus sp. T328-1]
MTDPAEEKFETDIVESLVHDQKYIQRSNQDYDKELCLDADMLFDFIRSTQPDEWQKLKARHGDDKVKEKFLNRLTKVLQKQGTLDVLRKGVKDTGCHFDLIYFKPETALNEAHQKKYRNNRFSVIRQLHYSRKMPNKSIDLCLFINGIPIITAELKDTLNGQDVENAIKQYRTDRDPAEPLLQFGRCFGHFAVDSHLVYMTTKLQ